MAKGKKSEDIDSLKETINDLNRVIASLGAEIKTQLTGNLQGADAVAKELAKTAGRDILKSLKDAAKGADLLEANLEKIENKTVKVVDITKQQAALKRTEEKLTQKLNDALKDGLITAQQHQATAQDIVDMIKTQNEELERQKGLAKIAEKQAESVLKYQERLQKGFTTLSKIPILGGMINVSKIMDKIKKTAEEGGSKWKQLGSGLGEMFKQLSDPVSLITVGISGIVSMFTTLFKWALEVNQAAFDLAKNLGVSAAQGERLNSQFIQMANNSGNLGLQSKEIAKSYTEITEQMGFIVPDNAAFAGSMALIQKRTGASAEAMEGLATAAAFSGKSVKSTYGTMIATAKVEAMRNGFNMTNRQIMDAVAKTSKTVLMNFGGNVKELTKALVKAKALGTTLEEIENKGKGLLDFESSIGKEFEFQALTGKQIDLSKARQLAQARKMPELMKELNKQGLTFEQWNKQGATEQQSYADLMSTSVEELNKMYTQQKLITDLGGKDGESLEARYKTLVKTNAGREILNKHLDTEAQADLARSSANDEWEATLQRIKETLGNILQGPVKDIIHSVTSWLSNTKLVNEFGMKVKGVFEGVANFVKAIPGYIDKIPNVLNKIITLAKLWFSISLGIAAANAAGSAALTPGGFLLAAGVGLVTYGVLSKLVPSFGGGGGGGAPIGGPAGGGNIEPMNNNAAAAKQGTEIATANRAASESSKVIQNNIEVKVGETKIAAATNKGTVNSFQALMDYSKAKTGQTAAIPFS